MVRPARVGTYSREPLIAGVANRLVAPTGTRSRTAPVAGSSALSTPDSGLTEYTRPPPSTGEPVTDSAACQRVDSWPLPSIRTARRPSAHGTYTVSPATAAPPKDRQSSAWLC